MHTVCDKYYFKSCDYKKGGAASLSGNETRLESDSHSASNDYAVVFMINCSCNCQVTFNKYAYLTVNLLVCKIGQESKITHIIVILYIIIIIAICTPGSVTEMASNDTSSTVNRQVPECILTFLGKKLELSILTVGKSGAGKSTLLNALLGIKQDEGFKVGAGPHAATVKLSREARQLVEGLQLICYDTPGISDVSTTTRDGVTMGPVCIEDVLRDIEGCECNIRFHQAL